MTNKRSFQKRFETAVQRNLTTFISNVSHQACCECENDEEWDKVLHTYLDWLADDVKKINRRYTAKRITTREEKLKA
jgi:hypothetical protein